MKPLKLAFSAFGPYAGRQELDFADLKGRNFFLIHGPTGAGKTTILDAICFALYGDSSGNLRDGRTMRSDHAGVETLTEVEFIFSLGDRTYKVWRSPEQERAKKRGEGTTISQADAALYELENEEEKLLAYGYSNTTQKIEELFGFKSSQFRQVVLLPQGDFRKLLLANSLERQNIMQMLFKTELYKQIEENLKEEARAIKQQRETVVTQQSFILQELKVDSVDVLAQQIEEQTMLQQQNERQVRELDGQRQAARQALENGKVAQSKFDNLVKAMAEQEDCAKLLPTVDQYKRIYERAQRAMQLQDVETQVAVRQSAYSQKQAQWAQVQVEAAGIAETFRQAEAALLEEQAKEDIREQIGRMCIELSRMMEIAKLTAEAQHSEAATAKLFKEKSKAKEDGAAALRDVKGKRQALQERFPAIMQESARIDAYQNESVRLNELRKKLNQQLKLDGDVKKLKALLEKAERDFTAADEAHIQAKTQAQRLQYLFMEGQAAVLAKSLQEGEPCPVCGSVQHPNPVDLKDAVPDEAEVKDSMARVESAEKVRQVKAQVHAKYQTDYQTACVRQADLQAELSDMALSAADLEARIVSVEKQLQHALACREDLSKMEQEQLQLEKREAMFTTRQAALEKEAQEAENAWQAALAVLQERRSSLPEKYQDITVLVKEHQAMENHFQSLKEKFAKVQQQWQQANDAQKAIQSKLEHSGAAFAESQEQLEQAQVAFAARLEQAGFFNMEEYRAAKKKDDYVKTLSERIALFEQRISAAANLLQAAQAETATLVRPDMASLQAALAGKEAAYEQAFAEWCRRKDSIVFQQGKLKLLQSLALKLQHINVQYGVVGTLADVANGNNSHGITFQRFVLKSLLNDVIEAANLRLKIMSRGQYMLQNTEERVRKNAAGGLDIEIFDHYTGYARPVATLSGGETFLASLSLALGLADVVQSYAGGIHLDTILVDEGFGTLDPESLDIALRALIDLQKGGRLVGIISHVPELRERIDARLEVGKTQTGSHAFFSVS